MFELMIYESKGQEVNAYRSLHHVSHDAGPFEVLYRVLYFFEALILAEPLCYNN